MMSSDIMMTTDNLVLPKEAQIYVDGIRADLARTSTLVQDKSSDQTSWTLNQTRDRYLPDALKAYGDVPIHARATTKMTADGKTADDVLIEELKHIAWATRAAAEQLIKDKGQDLVVNARFIADKFADNDESGTYHVIAAPKPVPPKTRVYVPEIPTTSVSSYLDPESEAPIKLFYGLIGSLALIGAFGFWFGWLPAQDRIIIKEESAVMTAMNVSDEAGLVEKSKPNKSAFPTNQPGQYVRKTVDGTSIIFDQQEHWKANENGLPRWGGYGETCKDNCNYLVFMYGKIWGRTP